ncbi:metallophosphoesterase [Neobacillus rhizosphaerae]|uniref:metallophosphoesterase n=1 Tax=Neobacillus rhizosphaerae TaxID=2880965 RepID=UPI003D2D1F41
MKRGFKQLFGAGLTAVFITLWAPGIPAKAMEEEPPNLQMAVMSDVHIDNNKPNNHFKQALTDLMGVAPDYDAIAIVGDMTNSGLDPDYRLFNQILQTYKNPSAEQLLSMGNHEYFESDLDKNSPLTDEMLQARFMNYTNESLPNIYYDKWIKGYHFISLAGELSPRSLLASSPNPQARDWAYISDQQYEWLEQTLAINASSNKPIFVFLHQPITNTVYGSINWGAGLDSERLLAILQKYPQVILFSGHSHFLLNHPKSIYQDGFTMVNTSSVQYTWYEGGIVSNLSQGYLVNVYDDRVELMAREFSNDTWIRTVSIPIPYREAPKDITNPSFTGNSGLAVSNLGTTSCTLSWNQAEDDSVVDRYTIKEAGQVIQTVYSRFWQPDEKVSVTLNNLAPDSAHLYEIYAMDAYENISTNPIKVTVTTNPLLGWYQKDHIWYYYTSEGTKHVGWMLDQNHWYYFDSTGAMKTGWVFINGRWYDFDTNGRMKTGWVKEGSAWYYLEPSGAMKTGWLFSGHKWYFLNTNGAMKTGWLYNNNNWYYLDSSGAMKTGWLALGNKWYYLKNDGTMVTNWYSMAGKWYYFASSGTWIQ